MSIHRHVRSAALVTLLAAAGCVTQGEFDKLQSEKNQEIASLQSSRSALEQQVRNLESQRESLEKQRDSLTKEKDSLTKEKDSLARENDSLARQRDSLTQQVAALDAQRAQLQATEKQSEERYDALLAKFPELDKSRVESVGRGWEEPTGETDSAQNRRVEVQWFTLE